MAKTIKTKEYRLFTAKLKKARLEAGLTQKQVSENLKKAQSYISKIEACEQRIDIIELKHFTKLYKKKIDYFI